MELGGAEAVLTRPQQQQTMEPPILEVAAAVVVTMVLVATAVQVWSLFECAPHN